MSDDPSRRSYRQFCGLARALDVVGERWTLLLVRNLLLGPRRYSDLLDELPGITTNLLARRLQELEGMGLVERAPIPGAGRAVAYRLTADGAALEPAIHELARWGSRWMDAPRPDDTLNVGWGMLSLKRRWRGGWTGLVEVRAGERAFELACRPDGLGVLERPSPHAALRIAGPVEAVRALFFGGVRAPDLHVEGDEAARRAFFAGLGMEDAGGTRAVRGAAP